MTFSEFHDVIDRLERALVPDPDCVSQRYFDDAMDVLAADIADNVDEDWWTSTHPIPDDHVSFWREAYLIGRVRRCGADKP